MESCYWPKIDLGLPRTEMKQDRYFKNRQQAKKALKIWESNPALVVGNKTLLKALQEYIKDPAGYFGGQ